MGKSSMTPEQVKILQNMRRRAPGGPDYLKGTQYERDRAADVNHMRRRELYRQAREAEEKAERIEAEIKQRQREHDDYFGL